jgi:hypothetical protein
MLVTVMVDPSRAIDSQHGQICGDIAGLEVRIVLDYLTLYVGNRRSASESLKALEGQFPCPKLFIVLWHFFTPEFFNKKLS